MAVLKWLEKTIDRSIRNKVLARPEHVKNGIFGDKTSHSKEE